ncbi:MAG: YceI family protein [Tannerella sp.]|jgi:hypothetical protein|nr:YceI family protein [Tannerella sp.]
MIHKVVLSLVCAFTVFTLQAQRVTTELQDKSWIKINGESNVVDFSFRQDAEGFIDKTMDITAVRTGNQVTLSRKVVTIAIKEFDSEDKMALRDFFKLVKADEHPYITVTLAHFDYLGIGFDNLSILRTPFVDIALYVDIRLAGVEKPYIIPVRAARNDGKVEITGSKKIDIQDFGLTPPTALFGMIKVKEWIEIDFQINLMITEKM